VWGFFPNHAWDVSGPRNISTTTIQTFLVFFLGNGWTLGTAGITKYTWEDEQWTIPLNLGVSRTMKLGGTPWKFGLEANYYVERSDQFGSKWMIALNVSPVVPNIFARWLGATR
jgi:hypothetical protein